MFRRIVWKHGQIRIDDFEQGNEVISTDEEKARVLSTTFFHSLPPTTELEHETLEHAWSTHRPPGPERLELVTPREILSTI